ncbi:MAG: hypothetical protein Q4B30_00575 [Coriobacteriaceae bacterium]|nr:hypothetical protein [Coriobacteriaceae bacterium]
MVNNDLNMAECIDFGHDEQVSVMDGVRSWFTYFDERDGAYFVHVALDVLHERYEDFCGHSVDFDEFVDAIRQLNDGTSRICISDKGEVSRYKLNTSEFL